MGLVIYAQPGGLNPGKNKKGGIKLKNIVNIANNILYIIQNLDDEDAFEFVKLYLKGLTEAEENVNVEAIIEEIADVDSRFAEFLYE